MSDLSDPTLAEWLESYLESFDFDEKARAEIYERIIYSKLQFRDPDLNDKTMLMQYSTRCSKTYHYSLQDLALAVRHHGIQWILENDPGHVSFKDLEAISDRSGL